MTRRSTGLDYSSYRGGSSLYAMALSGDDDRDYRVYLMGSPEVVQNLECPGANSSTVSELPERVRMLIDQDQTYWHGISFNRYPSEQMTPGDTVMTTTGGMTCYLRQGAYTTSNTSMWMSTPALYVGALGRSGRQAHDPKRRIWSSSTVSVGSPGLDWVEGVTRTDSQGEGVSEEEDSFSRSWSAVNSQAEDRQTPLGDRWHDSHAGPVYATYVRPAGQKQSQAFVFFSGILMGVSASALLMLVEYVRGRSE